VLQLARHGAKVYLGARSETKAHAAIERLHTEHREIEKGQLVFLPIDLSDLASVVKAAQTFIKEEQRLDILGKSFLLH
jgi:NAD(P)-dependent dehydrogenase (short-subunit alcohol dehydrogenase family)